jgi:hypothetical protein
MTATWAKRIRKLELQLRAKARPQVVFRYGSVQPLPGNPPGERHVAVSKSDPTSLLNVERCEFEERLGPASGGDEISFDVYLSLEAESEAPPNPLPLGRQSKHEPRPPPRKDLLQ